MAGNMAWNGVVKALDNTLAMRKNLKKGESAACVKNIRIEDAKQEIDILLKLI